jgi:hypothetical protein
MKAADIVVLTRDGLAFGHFEIDSTESPTDADRKAYPPVKQVYRVRKSVRYGNRVPMSRVGVAKYQFGKYIAEAKFKEILRLAGTTQESSAIDKHTNLNCEAWIQNQWRIVSVASLLAYPNIVRRCVECHGPVRLHKAGPSGKWQAHAENYPHHDGCSLGHTYDGNRRPNPNPVAAPRNSEEVVPVLTEELLTPADYFEGATVSVTVNSYERNPKARAACLRHYGLSCVICGFNFVDRYGTAAEKIIHVHHVTPLHTVGGQYVVDPINDLRPVCPNCHAVIHSKSDALTIEKVKSMLCERPIAD